MRIFAFGYSFFSNYAFCYFLGEIEPFKEKIIQIAKENNVENIKSIPSNLLSRTSIDGIVDINSCGPLELLKLISGAKVVITDSYHGVIFGEIFCDPVFCANRIQNKSQIYGSKQRLNTLSVRFGFDINYIEIDGGFSEKKSSVADNSEIIRKLEHIICNKHWRLPVLDIPY